MGPIRRIPSRRIANKTKIFNHGSQAEERRPDRIAGQATAGNRHPVKRMRWGGRSRTIRLVKLPRQSDTTEG